MSENLGKKQLRPRNTLFNFFMVRTYFGVTKNLKNHFNPKFSAGLEMDFISYFYFFNFGFSEVGEGGPKLWTMSEVYRKKKKKFKRHPLVDCIVVYCSLV